jgi:hypothetical protein
VRHISSFRSEDSVQAHRGMSTINTHGQFNVWFSIHTIYEMFLTFPNCFWARWWIFNNNTTLYNGFEFHLVDTPNIPVFFLDVSRPSTDRTIVGIFISGPVIMTWTTIVVG